MMALFDPDLPIYENWKDAAPLDFAWFYFATVELKEQYRGSGDNDANAFALRQLMQGDVSRSVANFELIALGIQTIPSLEIEPIRIPPAMFASGTPQIDWEKSIIEALGRKFEEVRICVPTFQIIGESPIPMEIQQRRGGGRRSAYENARVILAALFAENPIYRKASPASLLPIFNERYLIEFGQSEIKIAPISERSFRDHVKRYRQELAETGSN
jgi:hypothetical protein